MRLRAKYAAAVLCLVFPAFARAQSIGQVECPRGDGYVYLYSSMTTLDVRTTLQCGEQVQITGRYDLYFGVRSAKGEIGYVPVDSLLLLKDKSGAMAQPKIAAQPARERTPYDAPATPTEASASAPSSATEFTLHNGTPIHLKLGKTISSATAHVGDVINLQVAEEVTLNGLVVIPRGAAATAVVMQAEPKKRLGHGGKLGFNINSVRLGDDEKAAIRSYQESSSSSGGAMLPLASGKDVVFTEGTDFTAYVDGDMKLKKAAFQAEKDSSNTTPAPANQKPSKPRGL